MDVGIGTYGLAFAAGALSILSPCVLPLLPIVIGGAATTHRLGPLALIAGMAVSFTAVGVLLATVGPSLGLDETFTRAVGAILLVLFGVVLVSGTLGTAFGSVTGGLANRAAALLSRCQGKSLRSQFVGGALLGLVWLPCIGPTLGAAMTLAAQDSRIGAAASVMAVFAVGTALPLVVAGQLSGAVWNRFRQKFADAGLFGRRTLGLVLLVMGALILTGFDKTFEAWLLDVMPEGYVSLTTRY